MPQESNKYNPTKMIVCGGGPKGRAYKPVIRVLHNAGLLEGVKDTYGSSVGALLSGAVSLGLMPDQIDDFLDTNPKIFQDAFQTKSSHNKIKKIKRVIRNLSNANAAFKGDALFQQAQNLVALGGLPPNATMKELADLVEKEGKNKESMLGYKNLHVTATVEDPRGAYQIILDAETVPNMPIALAMRMSAALPGAFPAIALTKDVLEGYRGGNNTPLIQYDRGEPYKNRDFEYSPSGLVSIVDGGLVDNLPQYLVQEQGEPNADVISLNLEHPKYGKHRENYPAVNSGAVTDKDENDFLKSQKLSSYHKLKKYFKDRKKAKIPPSRLLVSDPYTVHIDTGNVTAFTFNMSDTQHQHLINSGHNAICNLLTNQGYDLNQIMLSENELSVKSKIDNMPSNEDLISSCNELLTKIGFRTEGLKSKQEIKVLARAAREHKPSSNAHFFDDKKLDSIKTEVELNYSELMKRKVEVMNALQKINSNLGKRKKIIRKIKRGIGLKKKDEIVQLKKIDYQITKALNIVRPDEASQARNKGRMKAAEMRQNLTFKFDSGDCNTVKDVMKELENIGVYLKIIDARLQKDDHVNDPDIMNGLNYVQEKIDEIKSSKFHDKFSVMTNISKFELTLNDQYKKCQERSGEQSHKEQKNNKNLKK